MQIPKELETKIKELVKQGNGSHCTCPKRVKARIENI